MSVRAMPARRSSIRTRMYRAFTGVVLVPLLITTVVSGVISAYSSQQRLLNQLDSVATLKQAEIQSWVGSLETGLGALFTQDDGSRLATLTRASQSSNEIYQVSYAKIKEQINLLLSRSTLYDEIFILDPQGTVVLSTNRVREGVKMADSALLSLGSQGTYLTPPTYQPTLKRYEIYIALPLPERVGQSLGVLVALARTKSLDNLFLENTGLGVTGQTYLLAPDGRLVTALASGERDLTVTDPATLNAFRTQAAGSGGLTSVTGELTVAVYRRDPTTQSIIVVEQARREAFAPILLSLAISIGVVLLALFGASYAARRITQSIADPLAMLDQTTRLMAAGNLNLTVPVRSEDEIGSLAQAFNQMAGQLRELVTGLEARVAERTQALERRSVQLEAASEVAREVIRTTDLNELLSQAVNLIRDRFGFYHAGIFLLDERGEFAVLQAATGQAGREMLARHHQLRVGEVGLVGYATGTGKPRIALDVGADASHFKNPSLPDTRSEMALPLINAGQVIGALDVQSTAESAFGEEDITTLQTMADQLAVAIENARLIKRMETALRELEQAYGKYTQQSWRRFTQQSGGRLGYRDQGRGVEPSQELQPEAEQALRSGSPQVSHPSLESPADTAAIAVPIRLRDQVIGVLNLRFRGETVPPDALTLTEAAANRLALVLDNARLLDEARQRAEREQQLAEVTGRMRQSLNVESVLQTAVREIYTTLGLQDVTISLGEAPTSPTEESEAAAPEGAPVLESTL